MRNGFSLVEILIVVAISVSVIFVVGNFNGSINLLNGLVSQELQSKSDITQTLQILTTEVRSAGIAQNGAFAIAGVNTSSFIFYSSINKNWITERVRYFYSSSTIYKGVIEPTGTPAMYPSSSETVTDVIDNVVLPTSTPLFQYYDASYVGSQAALAYPIDTATIRLVAVSFGAIVKPQQSPGPQNFSILVDIRNLRSN
jgi:prepilin-type N-terminal cleavage/methylation domain-containing protein